MPIKENHSNELKISLIIDGLDELNDPKSTIEALLRFKLYNETKSSVKEVKQNVVSITKKVKKNVKKSKKSSK